MRDPDVDRLLDDTHPEYMLRYVGSGNAGRLSVYSIWRRADLEEIGQVRFDREPLVRYLHWPSAVAHAATLAVTGDLPLIVAPDEDEDEQGFRCPGWSTFAGLLSHVTDLVAKEVAR